VLHNSEKELHNSHIYKCLLESVLLNDGRKHCRKKSFPHLKKTSWSAADENFGFEENIFQYLFLNRVFLLAL